MTTPSFVEVTASTIEDAIQKGLKQLGVGPGQVIVEVLEEPSRGVFGFGGKQARVRLKRLTPPPQVIERAKAKKKAVDDMADGPDTTNDRRTPLDASEADTVEDAQAVEVEEPEEEAADETQIEADVPVSSGGEDEQSSADDGKATSEPDGPGDTDEPVVVHGDHDDFFDEDGSYGADDEEFFTPAIQKREQRARQQAYQPETPTDETTDSPPEHATQSDESRRSREREQAQQDRRRKLEAQEDVAQPVKREVEQPSAADSGEDKRQSADKPGDLPRRDTGVRVPPLTFPENGTDAEIGEHVLGELLDIMRIRGDIEVSQSQRSNKKDNSPRWVLNINGGGRVYQDLVGNGGEALAALQYLTRLMVSKRTEARANIIVDVNDQRVTKADKLAKLAMRMADQVVETGRMFRMEPMPSHERRIVHTTLRKRDDIETKSQGQGDDRRVLIIPKKKDNS